MAVKETTITKERKVTRARAREEKDESRSRQLKIRLVRSVIGRPKKHREIAKGLGLKKLNSEVVQKECPEILGMIKKIIHLVEVEALEKK